MDWAEYENFVLTRLRRVDPEVPLSFSREVMALGGLGLAGEAGEAAEVVKKTLFHSIPGDFDAQMRLIEELGDTLWYMQLLAFLCGTTIEGVRNANVAKLLARDVQEAASV